MALSAPSRIETLFLKPEVENQKEEEKGVRRTKSKKRKTEQGSKNPSFQKDLRFRSNF